MHPALLEAYCAELPRLEAREHLATVAMVAAGTGRMEARARERLVADLARQAAGPRAPRRTAERPADGGALAAGAAARGIGVRRAG